MRNLILLFIRNGGGLVFVGLQALCFFLIIQFNEPHQKIFVSSLTNAGGWMDVQSANFQKVLKSPAIADSIADQNAQLRSLLSANQRNIGPDSLPYFSEADSLYQYVAARVIKNSVNRANNYIRLNKGRADGIEPNMGVISPKGVIGIVVDVSENYSLVMSILHQQTKISASVVGKKYFGSLLWRGGDPTNLLLLDMPKHADIQKGNLIETSGYSLLFPPGLTIGEIKEFSIGEGSSTYNIQVSLLVDLANIDYAYVVKHVPGREEQKSLESNIINE